MRARGECAAAATLLQEAVDHGHLPSRADLADMLLFERKGIKQDQARAFELVKEGSRLDCPHCQGVLAFCYLDGSCCLELEFKTEEERLWTGLMLGRESASGGSKYGRALLASWYAGWGPGIASDDCSVAGFRMHISFAQDYDQAQSMMGHFAMALADHAEALRWFTLAAAQGLTRALEMVDRFYLDKNGCTQLRKKSC